jgi:hypothetical protein
LFKKMTAKYFLALKGVTSVETAGKISLIGRPPPQRLFRGK